MEIPTEKGEELKVKPHRLLPRLISRIVRIPFQLGFRWFCKLLVWAFYRRCEVAGRENFPVSGPVILCANHPSALMDALILQSILRRPLHPLARSGLFRNPLLWPFLFIIQAVPVHRRQDTGSNTARNLDAFETCYELLGQGGALLIFPEGESHHGARLKDLRTGAARIALGAAEHNGRLPAMVPVGLTFTQLGRFRSTVLVNIAPPIEPPAQAVSLEGPEGEQAVRLLTETLRKSLGEITLDTDSWEDVRLLRQMERFFALRRGRYRKTTLSMRFRTWKKLDQKLAYLRREDPEKLESIRTLLERFERHCERWGIRDYHLTLRYSPGQVLRFMTRSLLTMGLILPLAVWGWLNSVVPFRLTGFLALRLARGRYQYETAQIAFGLALFGLCWGGQVWLAAEHLGQLPALVYGLSLPPSAACAMYFARDWRRILENLRVFFMFMGRRSLKEHLREKRREIEYELARLTQLAKRPR